MTHFLPILWITTRTRTLERFARCRFPRICWFEGMAVTQYVPLTARAWHAGESCFRGAQRCNDYSIGIELEGEDETPYDDRQYNTLTALLTAILGAYPAITAREIAGHCDVAPGRKSDPGPAFDWLRLYDGLSGH